MAEKLQIVVDIQGGKAITTLKKVDDGVEKIGRAAKKTSKSVSGLRNVIGGIALGASAKAAFDSIVSAGMATERIMNTLDVATGDAANSMEFLRSESDRLGLNLEKSAIAFSKFSAAAKGTALEGQGARDVFSAVATASTAMGLTAEQAEGAMRALEQMMSKGNVQAEELRGQLGERLPGAFNLAAKSMGVTTTELNKMLERGEVLAEDLLPKLAKTLNDEFGEGAQTASGNAQAQFNRLSTAIFTLSNAVAESGVLQALGDMAGIVAESANAWATWINVWNESETDAQALAFRINDLGESISEMAANGEDVAALNAELARLISIRSALLAAAPSGGAGGAGAGDGEVDKEQIKLDKLLEARRRYFYNLTTISETAEGSETERAIAAEEVRFSNELARQAEQDEKILAQKNLTLEQEVEMRRASAQAAEQLEAKHKANMKKIDDTATQGQVNAVKSGLGQLSALMNSENRKAFEVGKAAATANAVIKTYEAATAAYASLAGIPIVGPALGAVAAAAAVAAGMANVQAIQSTTFGSKGAGAAGGGGIPNVGGGAVPVPQQPAAQQQQQGATANITLIIQALEPNSITDETRQKMADSLAAPLQKAFDRGVGANRAVLT